MSTTSKSIISIIVIIVIILLAWWYVAAHNNNEYADSGTATDTSSVQPGNTSATGSSDIASSTDASDASLNQDMTHVDSQINGLNSDSANVDQSLNDQPISQ